MLDAEGWFHSGDLGQWVLDEARGQRYLKITGSNGRRFPLSLPGLPWVWPEVLEGYFRDKVEDVAVRTVP